MYNNLRQKSIPVRDDRKLQPRADARAKQKGGIMEIKTNEKKFSTRTLTVTAMFLAMNIIMSSSMLSVPVPGGHIYLNNAIITIASILLNPLCAFIVGGIGAFIGDLLFYPAPMFVSLVTHGIQAIVVSLCARKLFRGSKLNAGAVIGVILGIVINTVGYSLGRAFIYSTPEYAVMKLPYQILEDAVGSVLGYVLCFACGIKKLFEREFGSRKNKKTN